MQVCPGTLHSTLPDRRHYEDDMWREVLSSSLYQMVKKGRKNCTHSYSDQSVIIYFRHNESSHGAIAVAVVDVAVAAVDAVVVIICNCLQSPSPL